MLVLGRSCNVAHVLNDRSATCRSAPYRPDRRRNRQLCPAPSSPSTSSRCPAPTSPASCTPCPASSSSTGCSIVESQQYGDRDTGLFFMRVHFERADPAVELTALRDDFGWVGDSFQMSWQLRDAAVARASADMVSKFGHCLNDLLFRHSVGRAAGRHRRRSSPTTATSSALAAIYGIPFHHVPVTPRDQGRGRGALLALVESCDVDLVVLARYMQVLSDDLCKAARRPGHQHPPLVPAELQGRQAVPPGARARREAHRRHRALRHRRPRRGPDHRAGGRPGSTTPPTPSSSSRSAATWSARRWPGRSSGTASAGSCSTAAGRSSSASPAPTWSLRLIYAHQVPS